jgi:hypothetical protein
VSVAQEKQARWGSWFPDRWLGDSEVPEGIYVSRTSWSGLAVDWMKGDDGKLARFDTMEQARAAIAAADGRDADRASAARAVTVDDAMTRLATARTIPERLAAYEALTAAAEREAVRLRTAIANRQGAAS